MNWRSMSMWAFGAMALITIAILVIIAIFYSRVRKNKWPCGSSSSSSCDSSSSSITCPLPTTTGPTGCIIVSSLTGCDTFLLTMDVNQPCSSSSSSSSSCGSSSSSSSTLVCPTAVLTVKKPLPLDELILTVTSATGTFITDIYAQAVPAKCDKARIADFNQTGCFVDLTVGYENFIFGCIGGSNVQSVTIPLTPNTSDAFLSVVVNIADTCGEPLVVDQLTIEGTEIPHRHKGCTKPPKVFGCVQPVPRYAKIHLPSCCKHPQ